MKTIHIFYHKHATKFSFLDLAQKSVAFRIFVKGNKIF